MGRSLLISFGTAQAVLNSMNKLLLLALLGFALVALTAGEEESNENSLAASADMIAIREARAADPGRNKKNKKAKKSKKSKKAKKSKKTKKRKKTTCRQSTTETCLNNALKYMQQYKNKIGNYEKQYARILKFEKLVGNKGAKKGDFAKVMAKIREAGGGNSSALKCQDSDSNSGATLMNSMVTDLNKCEDDIHAACVTAMPALNKTEMDACTKTMDSFKDAVDACIAKPEADLCTCLNDESLATMSSEVGSCDISSVNTKFTSFKKSCTKAFGACRKVEDEASKVIFACGDGGDVDTLLAKMKAATANKAAIDDMKTTVAAKAAARMVHRTKRAMMTCSMWTDAVEAFTERASMSLANAKIADDGMMLVADAPAACTAEEKIALMALVTELEGLSEDLTAYIDGLNADLEAVTGTTADAAVIAAAGGAATTTMAPSKRRVLKMLLNH